MKKSTKIILGVGAAILAAAAVRWCIRAATEGRSAEKPALAPRSPSITDRDFLKVEDSYLANREGERVLLRGVNLGGWLIQECWMCPVSGQDGQWGNLDTLEALKRSGYTDEQIQQLFDTYQSNWITESDLDIIAESGANCVRVPFWYRNFMLDEDGTWIDEDPDQNPGFRRLDWLIEQAGQRGLYVVLDMHGCPGGQSADHCCGTVGRNDLFFSDSCRETMKKLWVAIAARYRGNPTVAAYDIMNEPNNNGDSFKSDPHYLNPWESKAWEKNNQVYREMVAAIREADPEHVISLEGIWRITNLPDPRTEGWTNMLYQVHLYDDTNTFRQLCTDIADYAERRGVAVYVGEFSNMQGIQICEELGISWTTWTYKGGKGANGTWFWYYASPRMVVPDRDDFDTAMEKWGESLRTENFYRTSAVCGAVEKALRQHEAE